MTGIEFKFDNEKEFPTLPHAPIVEAVIHWQAAASVPFTESDLATELKKRFPKYEIAPQHNLQAAFTGSPVGMEFKQRTSWEGCV